MIWRGTDAEKEDAPYIITGDEETYTFLRHIAAHEHYKYCQIRRYPAGCHLPQHVAKAVLKLYWSAGVETIAQDLGTDKYGDGGQLPSGSPPTHRHVRRSSGGIP